MATKKTEKTTETEVTEEDPLKDFPTDVKGGRWEYDDATGDRRWVTDDEDA